MLLRSILLLILIALVLRALARAIVVLRAGAPGSPPPGRRARGTGQSVHMVRDPVCGTFVIPERALARTDGSRKLFFCSATCRDRYDARPPSRASHSEPVEGRSA
jgi:YHS domain-containing protein